MNILCWLRILKMRMIYSIGSDLNPRNDLLLPAIKKLVKLKAKSCWEECRPDNNSAVEDGAMID